MSDERWERNVKRAMELVAGFPELRRKRTKEMLDGPVGEQFFTAPASTREGYHNCFAGGLLEHSLNVVHNAIAIATALGHTTESLGGSIAFSALFHDLGKCGDGTKQHYVQVTEDWKIKKGERYEVNRDLPYMTTGERGMWLLWKHGLEPTYEEMMALRLNDGPAVPENEPYAFKTPLLALIVHWADHYSMVQEKGKGIG